LRREHKLTPRTLITHSLMSFYLPNANKNLACNQACFFQGRETWGAYFDSDGRIEASDFWLGFFIVQPPN
jgi:hypothetical protein